MKALTTLTLIAGLAVSAPLSAQQAPVNPAIDMEGYLRVSQQAAQHREPRRISEADFLRMSREPGTIVLDARSRDKFDELHVKGAVHLAFTDFSATHLAHVVPDTSTRILIYCNNNFSKAEGPFFRKSANASLNLSTYIALYSYGYRNVYELGPKVDLVKSVLPFESSKR